MSDTNPPKAPSADSLDSGKRGLFERLRRPARAEPPDGGARPALFERLRTRLQRTRQGLLDGLSELFLGKKTIDDEVLEELETRLLLADVGVDATRAIMTSLSERVSRRQLTEVEALLEALRGEMQDVLAPCEQPLRIAAEHRPFVILMVGVNGVGKTTTIGKLARRLRQEGHSVLLAAGDTFRAAAVEQLQLWGKRNDVAVIAQPTGSDAASVIYDGFQAARARRIDVLIADTAGRLHTQSNLMEELKKIKRVIAKVDPTAPHESMLVVDAGTGQNALAQALQFHQAIGISGITLTKLDGTARGGIIFAIAKRLGVPIRYIGVGESVEDLRPFAAGEFVAALLERDAAEAA